ncbi:MAG: zinc-ribbon domain-containing protein [Promethearchaeota archaeon]
MKAEAKRRQDSALSALHGKEYAYRPSRSTPKANYAPRSRQKYCKKCGHPLDPLSSFCSECGTSTHD